MNEVRNNVIRKEVPENKIRTSKQVVQRLLIALAQVNAGNESEKLLNKIRQLI